MFKVDVFCFVWHLLPPSHFLGGRGESHLLNVHTRQRRNHNQRREPQHRGGPNHTTQLFFSFISLKNVGRSQIHDSQTKKSFILQSGEGGGRERVGSRRGGRAERQWRRLNGEAAAGRRRRSAARERERKSSTGGARAFQTPAATMTKLPPGQEPLWTEPNSGIES